MDKIPTQLDSSTMEISMLSDESSSGVTPNKVNCSNKEELGSITAFATERSL